MYTLHISDLYEEVFTKEYKTKAEAISIGEEWKKQYKDISYHIDEPVKDLKYSYGTNNK